MGRPDAAILVNQAAGSAGSDRVRRAIELAQAALGADVHIRSAADVVGMEEWLRTHIDRYSTVIVAGGDGSLGAACNLAAERDGVALGFIPAGVGNATAHLLRLPRDPEALARVLARGEARPVDLVTVDGRAALFAGVGWDARVVARYVAGGLRRMPGWVLAVTRSLPELWRRPRVEVRADGWLVHRGPMELLVVGTTPFYGRGLYVNPGARHDAGRLSLRVYGGPATSMALEAARWVIRRRPRAELVRASTVDVRATDGSMLPLQADGEFAGEREAWRFELRPAAVKLIGRWG